MGAVGDGEVPAAAVADGDSAGFGGGIQAVGGGVVGQDVGVIADAVGAGDAPGGQVEGEEAGVAVAGNESEPVVAWPGSAE
ncbi:hypothetical protein GR925_36010 [Streptomyces sp. HUCO-GS316]|uniref:hypothetical protein n=1 Tax=Streptomyces sp. HUCO-GS316 TaxID=2692198 RepID=UPI00136A8F52|nr:hypothetical protein [Streptomyces sp. HUCO-GS316]MXM68677.1 hypothetical protein [Streptomyces sp. HUCO-GS316]